MTTSDFILCLIMVLFEGLIIGFERQLRHKTSCLKTNMLVATGAGVIFREGANVHGLGSAATIWCSAAIGSLAASGYYVETLICTLLIIIINTILEPIDKWLINRK